MLEQILVYGIVISGKLESISVDEFVEHAEGLSKKLGFQTAKVNETYGLYVPEIAMSSPELILPITSAHNTAEQLVLNYARNVGKLNGEETHRERCERLAEDEAVYKGIRIFTHQRNSLDLIFLLKKDSVVLATPAYAHISLGYSKEERKNPLNAVRYHAFGDGIHCTLDLTPTEMQYEGINSAKITAGLLEFLDERYFNSSLEITLNETTLSSAELYTVIDGIHEGYIKQGWLSRTEKAENPRQEIKHGAPTMKTATAQEIPQEFLIQSIIHEEQKYV